MSPEERATFAALADVLVPEAARHAGGIGRRRARAPARRGCSRRGPISPSRCDRSWPTRPGGRPTAEVARLRAEDDERFRLLLSLVTAAYYSSPKVRRLIGYPGQRAHEVFPDQAEHDLRDGILDPVVARGPIWHRPPA